MRKIKFRVWDNIHEIMMKLSEVNTYSTIDIISNVFKESLNVMQYIGLKDKNGKEIYEGDIVNIRGGAFYQGYWEINEIFEVIYNKTGFFLKNKDYIEAFWIAEEIEVIGNIYENPELLKEK